MQEPKLGKYVMYREGTEDKDRLPIDFALLCHFETSAQVFCTASSKLSAFFCTALIRGSAQVKLFLVFLKSCLTGDVLVLESIDRH